MTAECASDDLLGRELPGRSEEWEVYEKLASKPGETPGFFSYTYKARSASGAEAFVKASDIGMKNLQGIDFLDRLVMIGQGHQFERQVLDHCRGNNMDRVVVALDYGDFEIDFGGSRDRVFFIIFELAESDLRCIARANTKTTLLWSLVALRNLFVGVNQLHAGGVCHNDFKPANCLLFDERMQKVADLGRATSKVINAPHGGLCVGDVRYAAPEQLYANDRVTGTLDDFEKGRAGDLFSLGSVIHFILAKRMVSPEVINALAYEFKPREFYGGWQDSYVTVLPHWRVEFDAVMANTKAAFVGAEENEKVVLEALMRMVLELCEPDPRMRGHPRNRQGQQDQYGLARYITELDLLARRAKIAGI